MTYRTRRSRGGWHSHEHWHGADDWPGRGRGRRGRRFADREELISALEHYQRNLEQRAADVAEKIRRLRAQETAGAEGAEAPEATPTTHNV